MTPLVGLGVVKYSLPAWENLRSSFQRTLNQRPTLGARCPQKRSETPTPNRTRLTGATWTLPSGTFCQCSEDDIEPMSAPTAAPAAVPPAVNNSASRQPPSNLKKSSSGRLAKKPNVARLSPPRITPPVLAPFPELECRPWPISSVLIALSGRVTLESSAGRHLSQSFLSVSAVPTNNFSGDALRLTRIRVPRGIVWEGIVWAASGALFATGPARQVTKQHHMTLASNIGASLFLPSLVWRRSVQGNVRRVGDLRELNLNGWRANGR